jgi:hypothetical protein
VCLGIVCVFHITRKGPPRHDMLLPQIHLPVSVRVIHMNGKKHHTLGLRSCGIPGTYRLLEMPGLCVRELPAQLHLFL